MKYLFIILFVFFVSCKKEPIIYPEGGYAFINTDTMEDKSFPCFPVRDLMDTRDSMNAVFEEFYVNRNFKIPNISLKPAKNEIFILSISTGFNPYYFFTLTDSKIIAKKCEFKKDENVTNSKLTDIEEFQLEYLKVNFPLKNGKREHPIKERWKHFADSLLNLYPEMGNANYYKYLFYKAYPNNNEYSIKTDIISFSYKKYKNLIDKINSSGYWKLPLHLECNDRPTDGTSFSLEANNGKKYNLVSSGDCMDYPSDFKKACQEIINYAHYEKEIRIAYVPEAEK